MFDATTTTQPKVVTVWPDQEVYSAGGAQCRSAHSFGLFRELSEDQCAGILSLAVMRRFSRGQFIFAQGEPVRSFMLLQSGIVKHTQISTDGKEVLLRISGRGDVLNVRGNLGFHTCSSRAMENGVALAWQCGQIEGLFAKYPQLRINCDRLLVMQLEELEERFREIATETVATRLALLLFRLCKQVGRKSAHGLHLSITREELAQMTGATVYTISRLLTRWAEQGFLFPYRQAIVVIDTEKLPFVKDVET